MKVCTKCKQYLSLEAFYKHKSSKDGLRHICKECVLKHNKDYYVKNCDKINAHNKQWALNNPEKIKNNKIKHKLKSIESHKKWRKNNLKKFNEGVKKCRLRCPQKVKEWNKKNRDKRQLLGLRAAENAKRRAVLLNAIPPNSNQKAVREFYKKCPKGLTVDHIAALQGEHIIGFHIISNLRYLHPRKNEGKNNRYLLPNEEGYLMG